MSVAGSDGCVVADDVATRRPREKETRTSVLVVDDDAAARSGLERLLRAEGFATRTASDGDAALAEARRALPDAVLTDLTMPNMGGAELCRRLHEIDRELPVIVMTGLTDMQAVVASLRAGAEDYLLKPLDYDVILWTLKRATARRAARREQDDLYRELNERLVLGALRDQEHAAAEARQRAQLNALLANLSEGVCVADQDGRILMFNDAARVLLGVGAETLPTVDALELHEFRDPFGKPLDREQGPLRRALRGDPFVDYAVVAVRPDGVQRHLATTGACVRDELGVVSLAIVVFRNVTELTRLERERGEYLALISHDLSNPLSSITLGASLLKRSIAAVSGRADELAIAERVHRNAGRMRTMIAELTEVAGFESQAAELRRDPCDLRKIVAGALDSIDDTRARRVTVEPGGGSSCVVLGDTSRLERVVANLLSNALKYSAEDAPVTIRVAGIGDEVELVVVDRGIGIAPEGVTKLFERYYRTPNGKFHASGLGLGLYITRLIVEAHGGRIEVSSELGKGSSFTLILPSGAA